LKNVNNLFCNSTAIFSEDQLYRYTLTRSWGEGPRINFIMLNPSTADENYNDPTIERCMRRADSWGFKSLIVTNIFAYRSTDPHKLYEVEDPVGPENDTWIVLAANTSEKIVCAWGAFVSRFRDFRRDRPQKVVELLQGRELTALKVVKCGQPAHPLYVNYSLIPKEWSPNGKQSHVSGLC
jgi:hypothetical protein